MDKDAIVAALMGNQQQGLPQGGLPPGYSPHVRAESFQQPMGQMNAAQAQQYMQHHPQPPPVEMRPGPTQDQAMQLLKQHGERLMRPHGRPDWGGVMSNPDERVMFPGERRTDPVLGFPGGRTVRGI